MEACRFIIFIIQTILFLFIYKKNILWSYANEIYDFLYTFINIFEILLFGRKMEYNAFAESNYPLTVKIYIIVKETFNIFITVTTCIVTAGNYENRLLFFIYLFVASD